MQEKIFCTLACIQWVLLSGLRGIDVGDDTFSYKITFNIIRNTSWHRIFDNIVKYIGGAEIKDPGYALFVKIFQVFSTNYQVYLIFIALLVMIPLTIWIYRNSSMPCLSFIIFRRCFMRFMRLRV